MGKIKVSVLAAKISNYIKEINGLIGSVIKNDAVLKKGDAASHTLHLLIIADKIRKTELFLKSNGLSCSLIDPETPRRISEFLKHKADIEADSHPLRTGQTTGVLSC